MGDYKLFQYGENGVSELSGNFSEYERDLQALMETNLEAFLGVRLLAHEHGTGKSQRGHIDTLGLDENGCPVIIEFKRRSNENVITQGLYYLDWLLDHQAEFTALVEKRLGRMEAAKIEFSWPRIICVASEFSRYDERAVAQIDRSVELVRYKLFGDGLILLEMVNSSLAPFMTGELPQAQGGDSVGMPVSLQSRIKAMNADVERLYLDLLAFGESLGEDVSIKFLKHYIAMTRFKNFTCVQPSRTLLKVWLNLDPDDIPLEDGFSRDVREVGHHSTGNVEINLRKAADFERVKPLIELAYNRN